MLHFLLPWIDCFLALAVAHDPCALLACGESFCKTELFKNLQQDLHNAMCLLTHSDMHLVQCNIHLKCAHLALAKGKPNDACKHLSSAKALVSECRCRWLKWEVQKLEEKLGL